MSWFNVVRFSTARGYVATQSDYAKVYQFTCPEYACHRRVADAFTRAIESVL